MTFSQVASHLLEKVIEVVSGQEIKAMKLELDDFIFWKKGVSP